MTNEFFERPILNSPYEYPERHWELDETGQPTGQIKVPRRPASFVTPIPKPKKQRSLAAHPELVFDKVADEISTADQRYDPTPIINDLRRHVELWRKIPDPSRWNVTPETARLLQHWRHRSAVVEVYPALWSRAYARADRTSDQHDAYSVAAWLADRDATGTLAPFFDPPLTPKERAVVEFEGWILGVM